ASAHVKQPFVVEVEAGLKAVVAANPVSTPFTSHTTKAGWALGAGAEVRLGGNWTGKIEYLYLDFGNVSTTASLPTNSTPLAINIQAVGVKIATGRGRAA